jgi:Uma2 family endonuclease
MTTLAANPTILERRWTAEEYRRLPEGPPYYELEEGELIEMPRPRRIHQAIIKKLLVVLDNYLTQNPIGDVWSEVEVVLSPTRVYVPDVSFLLTENMSRFGSDDDVAIQGSPDLAVEIVSPSTASRDRSKKLRAYYQAGVPWYWLVESDTLVITEYRYTADGYLVNQTAAATDEFAPTLFPNLTFRMADLLGRAGAGEVIQE